MLLGPFDTGTNLFQTTAEMNFPQMRQVEIWKHTLTDVDRIANKVQMNLPSGRKRSNTVVVAMLRSPISTIVSWKKAPYDLDDCLNRAWVNLDKPCDGFFNVISNPSSRTRFTSIMDVYNKYVQQYLDLKAAKVFKEVLLINYEDLVLDPLRVMQEFARASNITVPQSIQLIERPAKNFGKPVGRQEAIKKIHEREYLHDLAPHQSSVLTLLCKGINGSLIHDRVVGSFREPQEQISYLMDCK